MPVVGSLVGLFTSATFTGGLTVFGIATNSVLGRLLFSVASSALRAALNRNRNSDIAAAGIRTSQTQTGGINPASFILGTYATEGAASCPAMSHGSSGEIPNAFLTYVIELSDVPGQALDGLIIDGTEAPITSTLHPTYGNEIGGRFAGNAWVRYYDGSQTTVDAGLFDTYESYPARPWSSDMVGRGICYAILTFRFNREIFDGFPKVRFVCTGLPLYDPRRDSSVGGIGPHRYDDRSTWEPSSNTAVQIYNVLRGIDIGGGYVWGGGADASDLPLANWWAAMNLADTPATLAGGGSEPRFRSGMEVLADDSPADIIDQLLNACSGELAENGGVWKLRLGGPGLPVYFFTDDDLILDEPEEFSPFRAEQEPYNAVQATYPDPDTLWEPRDAPARFTAEFELADPAQRRIASLDLSACPYPNQAQRVMRSYVEEEQRVVRHVATLPQDALLLEQLDVVSWTSQRRGYNAKAFEIARSVDPLMMGKPRFTFRERDPADDAWIPDYELPIVTPDTSPVGPPVQLVENFDVQPVAIEDENGEAARPGLEMTWTGIQGDLIGIQFEIEAADGTTILTVNSMDTEAGVYRVTSGIEPNKQYRVRARYLVNRPTAFGGWVAVRSDDLRVRPTDLDQPSFEVAGLAIFGGEVRSTNFVQGETGWRINKNGDMEVQSLVTRDWIQDGALADGIDLAAPGGAYVAQDTTVMVGPIGPMRLGQLWHLSFQGRLRDAGAIFTEIVSGSDQNISYNRTTYEAAVDVQYRGMVGGVWQNWITAYSSGWRQGGYLSLGHVQHILGEFENAEVRAIMRERAVGSGNFNNPGTDTYPQPQFADFAIAVRAVLS